LRATGGRPGDRIGGLPVITAAQPGLRPITHLPIEVLRRLVESGQYTALAFTEELAEAGIAGSIGTVGDALDNALMESTIGLFKTECITLERRGRNWSGLREVERETAEWVRWYNTERIHSSIDYMTPIEREVMYAHTIAQRGEVA
jgi:transposase InsO family protein